VAAPLHPLLVNVAELLRRAGTERTIALTLSVDELGVVDERLDPTAGVEISLHLEALTDGVVVDGSVVAPWHGQCRRCVEAITGTVVADIHELYQATLTDPGAFPIEGDQIQLAPMVAETLLLDTPSTPLCRPDCAGLCPTCGINRNGTACGCEPIVEGSRWSALDALRGQLPDD
jgi:uncharacterized protein